MARAFERKANYVFAVRVALAGDFVRLLTAKLQVLFLLIAIASMV